jgi:hypothetical protein
MGPVCVLCCGCDRRIAQSHSDRDRFSAAGKKFALPPFHTMADPNAVASAFITHFNSLFDSADRTQLAPLYQETGAGVEGSMLSYEGTMLQGTAAIMNHYANPVRTACTPLQALPPVCNNGGVRDTQLSTACRWGARGWGDEWERERPRGAAMR